MSRPRRRWWLVFGAVSVLALVALGWISKVLLGMEEEKQIAQSQAQQAGAMRLALWRMDSWLGPQLAHEAARPYFEYLAFVPNDRAYTRLLSSLEPGEVLSPSPLLNFDSEFFPLHFQVDDQRGWTSPQVPLGNQLDLAQARLVEESQLARKRDVFESVKSALSPAGLAQDMKSVEVGYSNWIVPPEEPKGSGGKQSKLAPALQDFEDQVELSRRVQKSITSQNVASRDYAQSADSLQGMGQLLNRAQIEPQETQQFNGLTEKGKVSNAKVFVGPLLPNWIGNEAQPDPFEIYFLRRVEVGQRSILQGFVGNWVALRAALLAEVQDLFPGATVRLIRGEITDTGNAGELLAGIPARLDVTFPPLQGRGFWSPARVTLGLAWVAALLGWVGLGLALRASITYGEKRSRFASSVTHELRTPLTTFRMYTEMLANDMVPEGRRHEYLETLQKESNRLSSLVENVLAYARLEDGHAPVAREHISVDDLLSRTEPLLQKRASDGGHPFQVHRDVSGEILVDTDPGAVEQILFNLVDNACKYGRGEQTAKIDVEVSVEGAFLVLAVQDQGAGVPAKVAGAIFRPFDRGAVAPADPSPGIGLGLALCRGLARDLGGELALAPRGFSSSDAVAEQQGKSRGARFEVSLPLASSRSIPS